MLIKKKKSQHGSFLMRMRAIFLIWLWAENVVGESRQRVQLSGFPCGVYFSKDLFFILCICVLT